MNNLAELINSTYTKRTTDTAEQKRVWEEVSKAFPADLSLRPDDRPSRIIAAETGDLGLSVLWIVQAALIRPILDEFLKNSGSSELESFIMSRGESPICALANSESSETPVTVTVSGSGYILNGEKKFITAGRSSDFAIVSCRESGEEKISRLAIIKTGDVPEAMMPELKLGIMKSVSHTSMTLDDMKIKKFQLSGIPPQKVRRMIRKFGLLERSLILEAFLSYLLYAEKVLSENGRKITLTPELKELSDMQSESASKQISEAFSDNKITTENIPLKSLLPLLDIFKKEYSEAVNILQETERVKLKDLFLFDSLK